MKPLSPGSLATLDGRPVTILARAGARTYYISGFHSWTCADTERFNPVSREAPL